MTKKILVIIDRWYWALHRQIIGLQPFISEYYDVKICTPDSLYEKDFDESDVIYLSFWKLPFWSYDLKKLCQIYANKIIAGIHSHYSIEQEVNVLTMPDKDVPPSEAIQIYLSKFKALGTISPRLFKLFKNVHENVYYLKAGVNEKLFTQKNPVETNRSKIRIGWAGSTLNHPGKRGFANILQPLQKSYSDVFDFNFCIEHINGRNFEEMDSFYNEIDLYICVSRSEGASTPIREALSCGRPILSTNVGDVPDIIKSNYNGWIIPEWTLGATVENLLFLNTNRNILKACALNARKSILDSWTWERVAPYWLTAFEAVIGK